MSAAEWLAVALAAIAGGLGWGWLREARDTQRLQVDLTHERASHWRTFCALGQRDRQIGRLEVRINALQEIAAASSIGAQLYQALVAELREGDGPAEAAENLPHPPHA